MSKHPDPTQDAQAAYKQALKAWYAQQLPTVQAWWNSASDALRTIFVRRQDTDDFFDHGIAKDNGAMINAYSAGGNFGDNAIQGLDQEALVAQVQQQLKAVYDAKPTPPKHGKK